MAVAQKSGIPKWVALVSGNMDQNLRNPFCLILSHTQMAMCHNRETTEMRVNRRLGSCKNRQDKHPEREKDMRYTSPAVRFLRAHFTGRLQQHINLEATCWAQSETSERPAKQARKPAPSKSSKFTTNFNGMRSVCLGQIESMLLNQPHHKTKKATICENSSLEQHQAALAML